MSARSMFTSIYSILCLLNSKDVNRRHDSFTESISSLEPVDQNETRVPLKPVHHSKGNTDDKKQSVLQTEHVAKS